MFWHSYQKYAMHCYIHREKKFWKFSKLTFFYLREDFLCTLHDFMCILLSATVQDVESTVQDVETISNAVNLTTFSYWRFFNMNTHLKKHENLLAVTTLFSLCTYRSFHPICLNGYQIIPGVWFGSVFNPCLYLASPQ